MYKHNSVVCLCVLWCVLIRSTDTSTWRWSTSVRRRARKSSLPAGVSWRQTSTRLHRTRSTISASSLSPQSTPSTANDALYYGLEPMKRGPHIVVVTKTNVCSCDSKDAADSGIMNLVSYLKWCDLKWSLTAVLFSDHHVRRFSV